MLLGLLLLIFNITKTNAETKKIDLKKVTDKLGLKIEIAEKGKKLKGFFGGNSLILSKENKNYELKFIENNRYEKFEDNKKIESGKWKLSCLIKNCIRLTPDNKSKRYYYKKIKNKPIIYEYDKLPGNEGVKKILVNIISSSKFKEIAEIKETEEKLIAEEKLMAEEKLIADEPKLKLVNYDCRGMGQYNSTRIFWELDKENKIVKTHMIYPGGTQDNTFKIKKIDKRRALLKDPNSSTQFYWYYGTDQHTESALKGSHFYTCSIEDSSTSKIAKADTQSYSKPSKVLPLLGFSQSLLGGSGSMISSSITKTQLSQYNAKSATSYYFFHASSNLMTSLELLYRAYDQNTQADKLQSQIRYLKESKSNKAERLKSTKQIVDVASNEIASNIRDDSIVLSDQGKVYYQQSLPYAVTAAASSILLYKVAANTVKQILNADSGEAKLFAALVNLNEIIAIGKVAKQLPGFARNVASTSKLIFTGAKTKKIKDKAKNKDALDELDLDF